jgi:hypothetical protein
MATPIRQGIRPSGGIAQEVFSDPRRSAGVLHRSAITEIDKLAVPASPTVADVGTGGSLAFSTTYNCTLAAHNRWGTTTAPAVGSVATAADAVNTHVARVTTAAVTGADGYDLFLSVDAAPKWVARVTEAQRAAGVTVTAVGTVIATSPGANLIDIRVVGTGLASTANPFAANNAYKASIPVAVDCSGYSVARLLVKLAVTDLRSLPTLKLAVFLANQVSVADLMLSSLNTINLLTAAGEVLEQELRVVVDGSTGIVVLVDTISGQGAACSVWVELA